MEQAFGMEDAPAMGCSVNGAIPERVGCILSYGGSTRDVLLNYAMLGINLVGCWVLLHRGNNHRLSYHYCSFGFVWFFQLGLCLILAEVSDDGYGCAGISIVWCAMAGWMWHQQQPKGQQPTELRRRDQATSRYPGLWRLLVACNVALIVYYLITEEFITTLAHFCALIMGALLSWLVTKPLPPKSQ